MRRLLPLVLFFPFVASAAYFVSGTTFSVPEPIYENAYLLGRNVTVLKNVAGDLVGLAGAFTFLGNVSGDVLAIGGTINSRGEIKGDARIAGGQVTLEKEILGDLLSLGGVVRADAP